MKRSKYIGIIYVLIAGLLWGAMGVYVKYFTSLGLSSVDTALVRIGSAAILMLLYIFVKDKSLLKIKLRDLWCFFGSGVCSLLFFSLCYFEAIVQSSMSVAAVLLYLAPIFVMLMSRVFFKTKITARKVIAIFFSVGGCALVAGLVGGVGVVSLYALLLGIGSGFGYALYSIFSKFALLRGYNSLTITLYTFVFAFAGLLFFSDIPLVAKTVFQNLPNAVLGVLIGLLSAVLPYVFYTKGLESVEAGKASIIASVEPVCATVISVVFYHEKLTFLQVIGIISVIFSIVLLELKRENKTKVC